MDCVSNGVLDCGHLFLSGLCAGPGLHGAIVSRAVQSGGLRSQLLTVVANKPSSFPFCLVLISPGNTAAVAAQRLFPRSLSPSPPSLDLAGL